MNQTCATYRMAMLLVAACMGSIWGPVASEARAQVVVTGGGGQAIQRAINQLPAAGGQIMLAPRTYVCRRAIVINRSNVELRGSGPATVLRLADEANSPVLVLGSSEAVPSATRTNIRVVGLTIDGNRTNQTSETNPANPSLRNNGISLRRVESCRIADVSVFGCRSGGLVAELGCRKITVRDFESYDNHFDGLAAYETQDSLFTGLKLHDNLAAGLSFDIQFNNNVVSNSLLANNGTVGIFMRDSVDNVFTGMQVRNSSQHGIFLAQVDSDTSKPAAGNTFSAILVAGSGGAGLRVNDASCVNNLVVGAQFSGNAGGGISEAVPGLVQTSGTIQR